MQEKKQYSGLIEQARALQKETGCNILLLVDDGEDVGCIASGNAGDLRQMLRAMMDGSREAANIVLNAASGYLAERVADAAASKQAIKKAYDKTKEPS